MYLYVSQTSNKDPELWDIFLTQKPIGIHYLGHREIP